MGGLWLIRTCSSSGAEPQGFEDQWTRTLFLCCSAGGEDWAWLCCVVFSPAKSLLVLLCRSLVQQLQPPPALQQQLCQQLDALAAAAAANSNSATGSLYRWQDVWQAVKRVWASQWNDRALTALAKASLPLRQLRMGVLLQPLLPARYSWVAHTVNPASGSAGEVVVQLVVGLGEVLVGNHPGRAFGGVIKRGSLDAVLQQLQGLRPGAVADVMMPGEAELLAAVDVVSFASKDAAVLAPGMRLACEIAGSSAGAADGSAGAAAGGVAFMARSDSNAEDLPG